MNGKKEQFIGCCSLLTAWPFKSFCNNSEPSRNENEDCPTVHLTWTSHFGTKFLLQGIQPSKVFSSYTITRPPFPSFCKLLCFMSFFSFPRNDFMVLEWKSEKCLQLFQEKRLGHILPLLKEMRCPSPVSLLVLPLLHVSDILQLFFSFLLSIATVVLEQINKSFPCLKSWSCKYIIYWNTWTTWENPSWSPLPSWRDWLQSFLPSFIHIYSLTHILKMAHKTFLVRQRLHKRVDGFLLFLPILDVSTDDYFWWREYK